MDDFSKILIAQKEIENTLDKLARDLKIPDAGLFFAMNTAMSSLEKECLTRYAYGTLTNEREETNDGNSDS